MNIGANSLPQLHCCLRPFAPVFAGVFDITYRTCMRQQMDRATSLERARRREWSSGGTRRRRPETGSQPRPPASTSPMRIEVICFHPTGRVNEQVLDVGSNASVPVRRRVLLAVFVMQICAQSPMQTIVVPVKTMRANNHFMR